MEKETIWNDRKVVVDSDGTWRMSAVGKHDDFEYFPELSAITPERACMGMLPGNTPRSQRCKGVCAVDARHLLLQAEDGDFWCMLGNPNAGGIIHKTNL